MKNRINRQSHVTQLHGLLSWPQFIAAILGIALFLSSFSSHAQSSDLSSRATLNNKGVLQIPVNKPLASTYEFDVSSLGIKTGDELVEFLSTRSGDFYFIRARAESKLGILVLNLDSHPQWTITDWNKYLVQVMTGKPIKQ